MGQFGRWGLYLALRLGDQLSACRLLRREEFHLNEQRRTFCKQYADARFGPEVMSEQRLETLFSAPVATHILVFEEEKSKRELGYVVLYLESPRVVFYYYSFYDLGYFDDETCRLEPIDNPFGPKLLPMSPE